MAKQRITVSEALGWVNTLKTRMSELTRLRDNNSSETKRYMGEREVISRPVYDAKELDKRITLLQRELRLVDQAIKRSNARTVLEEYQQDDTVLGELV